MTPPRKGTEALKPLTPYQERAHLLTLPAKLFGSVISYNDPAHPNYPVLYVESPAGQLSWHIDPDDFGLFHFLKVVPDYPWDQHTTRQKYQRLDRLVRMIPLGMLSHANPEFRPPE